jgi:outer membrane protein OmpA-like peptidoglycan-associated protein
MRRHLPQGGTLKTTLLLTLLLALSLTVSAPTNSQTTMTVEPVVRTHTFRVNVISRNVQAVNYRHRSGATKVDFAGTDLMPSANGEAKVESKRGSIEIEVEFGNLQKPTTFGNEYLTYILWAISPEGRAVNLGEVLVGNNSRSKLDVTTDLQAFALIVTAEPYYAVRQPSNLVVLENVVREDTKGTSEAVNAKYELMERGGYIPTGYKFDPVVLNARLPLEFFEARNALRIAQAEGAEQYASDSYQHAVQLMNKADEYATKRNIPKKLLIAVAREAVQTAEDARAITVKKMDEERQANERQASADAQTRSRARADEATRQKEQAQSEAAKAAAAAAKAKSDLADSQAASTTAIAAAQADAEKSRLAAQAESEQARKAADVKAKSDLADSQAASATAIAAAQADAEKSRLAALAESEQARKAADVKAKSDLADSQAASATAIAAAQADAEKSRLAALAESERARKAAAEQGELEKQELRNKLAVQLNLILETRESARGLIVNISDVLFDTGKYTLRPGAREKLAKVSGIILAYPSLKLEVEGHTDSVGTDEYNIKLSENRATSVRNYLVEQGINTSFITARGFGKSQPVATNGTAAGRQQNRRVELVVSGDVIGTPSGR